MVTPGVRGAEPRTQPVSSWQSGPNQSHTNVRALSPQQGDIPIYRQDQTHGGDGGIIQAQETQRVKSQGTGHGKQDPGSLPWTPRHQHLQRQDCISRRSPARPASPAPPGYAPARPCAAPRGGGWGTAPPGLGSWLVLRNERPSDKIKAVAPAGPGQGARKQRQVQSHQGSGIQRLFQAARFIPGRVPGTPWELRDCGAPTPPRPPAHPPGTQAPRPRPGGRPRCPTPHPGGSFPLRAPRHGVIPARGGGTVWDPSPARLDPAAVRLA